MTDEGSRAGAELDAAAVLDDEAAKFSSLRMLSEYFQSRKLQQHNQPQQPVSPHHTSQYNPSLLSYRTNTQHPLISTEEEPLTHPHINVDNLNTNTNLSNYPVHTLHHHASYATIPTAIILGTPEATNNHHNSSTNLMSIPEDTSVNGTLPSDQYLMNTYTTINKDNILSFETSTSGSTFSSVLQPHPTIPPTRVATNILPQENVSTLQTVTTDVSNTLLPNISTTASLTTTMNGNNNTDNNTIPTLLPSPSKTIFTTLAGQPVSTIVPPPIPTQPTPVLLPTRVGGDKIQWLELDVTSPAAFQRISLGTDMLSEEGKAACESIYRAMQLRNKHFTCRKPDYYMGCYTNEDVTTSNNSSHSNVNSPTKNIHHTSSSEKITSPRHGNNGEHHHHGHRHNSILNLPSVPSSPKPVPPDVNSSNYVPPAELPKSPQIQKLFYRRRPSPKFAPFTLPMLPKADFEYKMVDGVVQVYHKIKPTVGPSSSGSPPSSLNIRTPSIGLDVDGLHSPIGGYHPSDTTPNISSVSRQNIFPVPTWTEFAQDYEELLKIIHSPPVKTFAFRRLELLAARFGLHVQLNAERESHEQKVVPHRDFYNVRKCDTHVHHSAAMNQKHLLRFIKSKLKKEGDTVVIRRDGKDLTLAQVFESLNLTAYDLSIDTLDMHADWSTFHRFDRFNNKYNPVGVSRLREIFLKTDNYLCGRFLAEITREIFDDLETSKYQLAEYRLSIYGRSPTEWRKLAAWIVNNHLAAPQVRWMIQVPRLYETYMQAGQIKSFQDMLDNIFLPLFEVTIDPSVDPLLHQFLGIVCGIDSVDDESRMEPVTMEELPIPSLYNKPEQPPYHYWTFYLAQNLAVLNKLRALRGLTQFSFRPHCGEAGNVEHLASGFLTVESINHGINLRRSPVLQYLYYLTQIGIAMSPLSNNRLFLQYTKNPFQEFFYKGLNVSLSTDDPLMLSYTKEPLLEEYAVATQVWRLSSADMCEIARNSVLQCGWEYPWKAHFLGPNYAEPGPDGNDVHYTNVPHIRLQYRIETLRTELELIHKGVTSRHAMLHRVPSSMAWVGPSASTFLATNGNSVVRSQSNNNYVLSMMNNNKDTTNIVGNSSTVMNTTTNTNNNGTNTNESTTKPTVTTNSNEDTSSLRPMIVNHNLRV